MKMPTTRSLVPLYLLVAIVHLAAEVMAMRELVWLTKPLLMPLLMLWYKQATDQTGSSTPYVLSALAFSTVGDILLMLSGRSSEGDTMLFTAGLGAFLIAQSFYIITFLQWTSDPLAFARRHWWISLLLTGYVVVLLWLVIPGIPGPLVVPVIVYALALLGAMLTALNLYDQHYWPALFAGVLFFVFSDSLIGLNRFCHPLPASGFLIMLTYLLGQGLIVFGAVRRARGH